MTEWSLPPQKSYQFQQALHQLEVAKRDDLLQFMRGGFWRNFLVRYPEINNQHKKMLRVHERVYSAGGTPESGAVHLWKAQANDTYWHGLFGGIYMTHVRSAIYHHLIRAENLADRILYGNNPWQRYEFTDFERDTQEKLLIESDQQNLYLDPQHGGTLFEWDFRRSAHNMLSVMTRAQESYHQLLREHEQVRRQQEALAARTQTQTRNDEEEPASPHTTVRTKEDNLDRYLVVDRHRRVSLVDHFLPTGLPLASFALEQYEELGNFVDQPYETRVEQNADGLLVHLSRAGQFQRAGALRPLSIYLTKTLFLPLGKEQLLIRYQIENRSQARLDTEFATELNINLLGGGHNPQAYCLVEGQAAPQNDQESTQENAVPEHYFDSTHETSAVQAFQIGNSWLQQAVRFQIDKPATLWQISIETVTGSEAGFERTHQGSCFLLRWPLLLQPGEIWNVELVAQGSSRVIEK